MGLKWFWILIFLIISLPRETVAPELKVFFSFLFSDPVSYRVFDVFLSQPIKQRFQILR